MADRLICVSPLPHPDIVTCTSAVPQAVLQHRQRLCISGSGDSHSSKGVLQTLSYTQLCALQAPSWRQLTVVEPRFGYGV